MGKAVDKTITAQGNATGWLMTGYQNPSHQLNLSIDCSSDWVGTIVLQRTRDGGVTVKNVTTFTDDVETNVEDFADNVAYRLYCSAYTAGQADVSLYR